MEKRKKLKSFIINSVIIILIAPLFIYYMDIGITQYLQNTSNANSCIPSDSPFSGITGYSCSDNPELEKQLNFLLNIYSNPIVTIIFLFIVSIKPIVYISSIAPIMIILVRIKIRH